MAENGSNGRTVLRYKIPKRLQGGGVTQLAVVQLTYGEFMDAHKVGGDDRAKVAMELLMRGLVEVNEQKVNHADLSSDAAIAKMTPPVRQLAALAFGKLNNATDEDFADFFSTEEAAI